ncbi:MAG TPA: hypothetical protein VNF68_04660 [Candidatus Baltobacteraceae bacterium]|nr:hypothetical protein [Candidatus Baltobacteraceae bacterium]
MDKTAAKHFQRREGGRTWTVIHDPRLLMVDELAREASFHYPEKNQAWFNTDTEAEAIREIIAAIEALPYYPIENAHYAADALAEIPGVAVSRQPFNTNDRDNPSKTMAVAVSEQALRSAEAAVTQALRIDQRTARELRAALDERKLNVGLVHEILGMRVSELTRAIDERTLTKPEAKELIDGITPISRWTLDKIVKATIDGTLEPRNCEELAGEQQPIGVDAATAIYKDLELTERHGRALLSYARSLATPKQRSEIAMLLESNNDQRGSISLSDKDIATLEKRDAYKIISKLSDRVEEPTNTEFLADERVEEYFSRRKTQPGKEPEYLSTRATASPATRMANNMENSRRYISEFFKAHNLSSASVVKDPLDRQRTVPARTSSDVEAQGPSAIVYELPDENATALRVITATRYHVAGYLDDARTTIAVLEQGHFVWPDATMNDIATIEGALPATPRLNDAPLEGQILVFERGERNAKERREREAQLKLKAHQEKEQREREVRLKKQAGLTFEAQRSGVTTLRDSLAAASESPSNIEESLPDSTPYQAGQRMTTYGPNDPIYFAKLADRDQTIEAASALARARCDARKLAPHAPVTLANDDQAVEGLAIGRHPGSVTILREDAGGGEVIAVPANRLRTAVRLFQPLAIPPREPALAVGAGRSRALVKSKAR